MANHKSAIKRIRQSESRRALNKYQHKTTRNAIKVLKSTTKKKDASSLLLKVTAMLDKLTKRNKGTRIIYFINQANTTLRSGNLIDILQ